MSDLASRLEVLRHLLPATNRSAYFNAGSNGPISRVVHEAMMAAAVEELEQGRIAPGAWDRQFVEHQVARDAFAELVGADPLEIGLMRSTTEGLNVALMGMQWRPGDEVITTSLEHICLFSTLGLLAHRHGVTVRTVDIGLGDGDVLDAIRRAVTPRSRAIVISHLSWTTGATMPIAEIAAFARERGMLSIIDGAQSTGQIPVDMHALGVDAYAMAGQKWLGGPDATGALFVRADRLGDIRPTYMRAGSFDTSGFVLPKAGAARYEMGGHSGPLIRGLSAAIGWLRDEVGMDEIYARTRALGARFHDGVSQIPGVRVVTPRASVAGIVCFSVDSVPAARVFEEAEARG